MHKFSEYIFPLKVVGCIIIFSFTICYGISFIEGVLK
jgi:hypothetical protein